MPVEIRCENCNATYQSADELERSGYEIPDLWDRVSPGEPAPSGECNECGSLCLPWCMGCNDVVPEYGHKCPKEVA